MSTSKRRTVPFWPSLLVAILIASGMAWLDSAEAVVGGTPALDAILEGGGPRSAHLLARDDDGVILCDCKGRLQWDAPWGMYVVRGWAYKRHIGPFRWNRIQVCHWMFYGGDVIQVEDLGVGQWPRYSIEVAP